MNGSDRPLRETPYPKLGYIRVGVAAPRHRVADVRGNVAEMEQLLAKASTAGVELILFPELGITAYSCGDLFHQRSLLEEARDGLALLEAAAARENIALVTGLPWELEGRLFNVAAVIGTQGLAGLVPKRCLPNNQEYYEQRWFAAGTAELPPMVAWNGHEIPFGTDLLFRWQGDSSCLMGVEICEDLWSVTPPSGPMALAGATLLVNPSASDELLGKEAYRRQLVSQQSARCLAAYAYASAGPGESSADIVFSGATMIAENGQMQVEGPRFSFDSTLEIADLDLDRLRLLRMRSSTFFGAEFPTFRTVSLAVPDDRSAPTTRKPDPHPFVPADHEARSARCEEIFAIQSTGLRKRLEHTGIRRVVLGLSGGLDSTLALLVCIAAFDSLGWARDGILAVTMPGLGTSDRTRTNATELARELGVELRTIPIEAAVRQHFDDIGQDPGTHDVTFENAQARERTQILMDLANKENGLVLGTGDLSEAALGWCTFNGDHMSMYHVNVGVPKTLVRYLVEWCAEARFEGRVEAVLRDICATPVSPELLPTDAEGRIQQETERTIGPYELHDFFLFQIVRHGFAPEKVLALAALAFDGQYADEELRHWLQSFLRRFYASQFKRNSQPDGPKVGSVALSPRGDWRMPSDAVRPPEKWCN